MIPGGGEPLAPTRIRTLDRQARSLVAILSHRILSSFFYPFVRVIFLGDFTAKGGVARLGSVVGYGD